MQPSIGRLVHYKLSSDDAERINRRRVAEPHEPGWPAGAQAHVGNGVAAGEVVPLVIVRVWPSEYGDGKPGVNGQALLDGNDQLWITSAAEGDGPGQWCWPPRV